MADHPKIPRKSTFSGPWDPWKPIGTHRCLGWPVDPDPGAWGLQVLRRPAMAGLVKSFWSVGWGGRASKQFKKNHVLCFLKYGCPKRLFFPLTISSSGIFCGPIVGNRHVVSGLEYCWQLTRPGCLLTIHRMHQYVQFFWIVKDNISSAYQITLWLWLT